MWREGRFNYEHPDKSLDQSIEKLEAFLANPIGIYLLPQDNFTGMDVTNTVLILSDHDFFSFG